MDAGTYRDLAEALRVLVSQPSLRALVDGLRRCLRGRLVPAPVTVTEIRSAAAAIAHFFCTVTGCGEGP